MQSPAYGILGKRAPLWGVQQWHNLPAGKNVVDLDDYQGQVIYLYCFQSWCPGCHSSGFPSMLAAMDMFADAADVSFVAVQTVFEGFEVNSAEKAQETAERYQLTVPVGHDPGADNSGSVLMRHYRTGGTPWTVIIGKDGFIHFNEFHASAGSICQLIELLRR